MKYSEVAIFMGHQDLKTSLQYLTEKYLKIFISKGTFLFLTLLIDPTVRCGDWDLQLLDDDQIHYAASDSYFSRELFVYFYGEYKKMCKEDDLLSECEWVMDNHLSVIQIFLI